MLIQKLQEKLLERLENNSLRKLSVRENLVDFFSNDYLGIAADESLYEQVLDLSDRWKSKQNGSTGSRLLSGNSKHALDVEDRMAFYFKAEKCLLFNSGYNANLSILSAIPGRNDTILYDELIHASLKDGARLSMAQRFSFRHNDLQDLEQKIKKSSGDVFVVVESVYSMDGDFAPLEALVDICERCGAHLIVDEAHSTGLFGPYGEGLCIDRQLERRIFARVYTFGKAMGMHGACIAGSRILIDYLINFARPFIYTTALPPHALATIQVVLERCETMSTERQELNERIRDWNELASQNLPSGTFSVNKSPIQVVMMSGNNRVRNAQRALYQQGLDARAILSPTVKAGQERIRICLHRYNTEDEIKRLVRTLQTCIE
ncbi:MAG: pyridoxal phosphate-dependent aminotransferase family protein [Cytophagaceae bacterium]|jgi:8-amino-7-oxononanoate synthase|nr:pyridoxal phosphate-dependent aminotransferase family protein [Cytophagaceae bacterium]